MVPIVHWKKKMCVILTWKVESLAELKFDQWFRVIREYLSLIIVSQYRVKTRNWESIWLKYSPIIWNPGTNFSFTGQWLNFLGQNDSIFSWCIYSSVNVVCVLEVCVYEIILKLYCVLMTNYLKQLAHSILI